MLLLFLAITVSGISAYVSHGSLTSNIFNVLVIVAGMWMLVWVVRGIHFSITSLSWPQCGYTISETKLIMQPSPGGQQKWNKYVPFFRLRYSFDGKEFSVTSENNLNLHVTDVFVTPHDANNYLSKVADYMYGTKLYVNPKEPGMAFLRAGITRDQIGVLVFSLIIITLPLFTIMGIVEWR